MKVLMIHGIGQQAVTADKLKDTWTSALENASPGILNNTSIGMAYYAKELAEWTKNNKPHGQPMGPGLEDTDASSSAELIFLTQSLQEVANKNGISDSSIQEIMNTQVNGAVAMDNFIYRRLVAIARAIESLSPAKGSILLRIIKQAYVYLNVNNATAAIDNLVRPHLQNPPNIIISHSLGTVIAFKLLREMAAKSPNLKIPTFITLGSPLGLNSVTKSLGPPLRKPNNVSRWLNFYDPSDFVTLGKSLEKPTFEGEIENFGNIDNKTPNAHGVIGYLPDKGLITELKTALSR
ncbi:hypothetical protein F3J44_24315 [Pantoea sp. Tr-811]|uniref:hypothetical protein n=1 Tax=Pantoea sp. Tr-811 TaxID=2608361 RepID=UPI0014207E08|nr:hypothetical protein [Pantoea sp. Tr-811]NIF29478.1 hypothetical protein [Pantoea sp. Tr-811]